MPENEVKRVEPETTHMFREAAEAASAVRAQYDGNHSRALDLGSRLRSLAPRAVITCARGSSDHAATFAKYLIETRLGVLTSSASPSVKLFTPRVLARVIGLWAYAPPAGVLKMCAHLSEDAIGE